MRRSFFGSEGVSQQVAEAERADSEVEYWEVSRRLFLPRWIFYRIEDVAGRVGGFGFEVLNCQKGLKKEKFWRGVNLEGALLSLLH